MEPGPSEIPDETLKELCEKLEMKATKKNKLLVAKLARAVGKDIKKLDIALKKARIDS